nr:hypothetical protein [Tanacetum cinerariifolium]
MALCTSLQRKYSELAIKFEAQEIEITRLKARVKLLEDRKGGAAEGSGDDALIKGRNLDEGEAAAERDSDDTEEMATVLTSMDATTVLASRAAEVPTSSGFIPTAGPPTAEVPTGSDVVPTASLVFATATVVTPYRRRKGKEVMVESDTPKKQKVQEQIDAQRAGRATRERGSEKEYHQFASELPIKRKIELISDLVKYQDNYAKIYKFQSQQRKPSTKKQKRGYYMAVIRSNLGWKVKDFRGMTFEEVEAKFNSVWKQIEDFIPMGSKEEAERIKRKGLSLKQESAKKFKPLEEVTEEAKSPDEVPEEKIKEMMQLNLMHAPVEWKLYDSCRVHHVTTKDKEIFMLVEKDYPLRKGLALVMISYKLQVENYSRMANDLILKIYKIASTPRQQVASEEVVELRWNTRRQGRSKVVVEETSQLGLDDKLGENIMEGGVGKRNLRGRGKKGLDTKNMVESANGLDDKLGQSVMEEGVGKWNLCGRGKKGVDTKDVEESASSKRILRSSKKSKNVTEVPKLCKIPEETTDVVVAVEPKNTRGRKKKLLLVDVCEGTGLDEQKLAEAVSVAGRRTRKGRMAVAVEPLKNVECGGIKENVNDANENVRVRGGNFRPVKFVSSWVNIFKKRF